MVFKMGNNDGEATQFQQGKSGNPSGRPPGARSFKVIIRELMAADITYKLDGKKITVNAGQAMIATQLRKAIEKEDTAAAKYLTEHLEGKPVQAVKVEEMSLNDVMRDMDEQIQADDLRQLEKE